MSYEQLFDDKGVPHVGSRFRCPLEKCAHKGEQELHGSLFTARNGEVRWKCHSCQSHGDFGDLYRDVHRVASKAEGWLHLIRSGASVVADVESVVTDYAAVWNDLRLSDPAGEAYLASRGLAGNKYVRFSDRLGPYRPGAALRDLSGKITGIQFRGILPNLSRRFHTIKGSTGYLGNPNTVRQGPFPFWVAEGWADTLTLMESEGPQGLGVTGVDHLTRLAKELEFLKIVDRDIVCFAQRDANDTSQIAFQRFKAQMSAQGNRVLIKLPSAGKDWNDACNS